MAYWFLKSGEDVDVTYTVTLDDVTYDLRLKWNDRDQAWRAAIGLTGEDPSASFKLTNGFNLLKPYQYKETIPPGKLYLVDMISIWGRVGFDDFGIDQRFRLMYIDKGTEDFIGG